MAIKAEEVCNTISDVKNSFNPLSYGVTKAVLRLSLHPRTQYHQHIHQPQLMKAANASTQQAIDKALHLATGLELLTAAAYPPGPWALQDPTTGPEQVAQPARLKGFELRRVDGLVSQASSPAASLAGAQKTVTCRRDFTPSSSRPSALDRRSTETGTYASKILPTALPAFVSTAPNKASQVPRFFP
jgi:hypothetical protein